MKRRSKKFFLHSSIIAILDIICLIIVSNLICFFRKLKHGDDNYNDNIKNVHLFTFDGKNIAIGVSDDRQFLAANDDLQEVEAARENES